MPDPTALLSGRYRYKSRLDAGTKAPTWLAVDQKTGKEVVASALPTARVAALMGVVGLKHASLAAIVEVVDAPEAQALPEGTPAGGAVVVAEHVGGRTLHQALKAARLTPAEAVTLWIRLSQGVDALHTSGGAHGAISPRSIVLDPGGERQGPILTQLLAPTSGAYCAPERLQGRGPSSADDTWALHAVLFSALTGSPPFRGDTKDQLLKSIAGGQLQRLKDFGINDEALQEILASGLVANLARRRAGAAELVEALERWEPRSERASDWEDVATIVASKTEDMAAAMRVEARPVPVPSIPPVPVEAEVEHEPAPKPAPAPRHAPPPRTEPMASPAPVPVPKTEPLAAPEPQPEPEPEPPPAPEPEAAFGLMGAPSPYDDENDQTTVMGKPVMPALDRALADSEPPALDLPIVPPRAPPPREPPQIPASPFGAAPPAGPSPGFPAPGSAFPPPISAFPPSIPGPPPVGIALPAGALDDEAQIRRASRRPILVLIAIVVAVAILVGVLLFLNYRGVITRAPAPTPSRSVAAARITEPSASARTPEPERPSAPVASALPPAAPRTEDRGRCVASHFEGESLTGDEDFAFLCEDKDFRGINSQLHRRLVVSGAGKVTPGMREWSALGWFELAVAAVIRAGCCPSGTPGAKLPETPGECQQLGAALAKVTETPLSKETAEARAKGYEDAVLCLFKRGIPRPYNYSQRPTGHARAVFTAFLTRASSRAPT